MRGRGWLCAVAVVSAAYAAVPAHAVTNGSTVLIDRPTGFGALPFDGTNTSVLARHALSANACFVVFASRSDNLSATDDNAALNVFRRDRCSAGTPLVQVNTTGTGAPAEPGSNSVRPSVSADGRFVAFTSNARNLDPAGTSGADQIYVKDLQTGSLRLVSRANGSGSVPAANQASDAVITGDGTKVVFLAFGPLDADNFDGVTNESDLYLRDLIAGTTHMLSVNTANNAAGHGVGRFDADHTGNHVAFVSNNKLDPVNDTDTASDAYVRMGTTTQLVSTGSSSDSADRVAFDGSGMQMAFSNGKIWTSTCILGSCTGAPPARRDDPRPGGTNTEADDAPFFARTGTNPAARLYWVTASNLDPADTNGALDIYARDLADGTPATAIHLMTGGNLAGGVVGGDATDDGALVVFQSSSGDLPGTGGLTDQVFGRTAGQNTNISQPAGQPARATDAAGAFMSSLHAVSDDGRFVVFATRARGLGPPPTALQVYVRDVVTGATTPVSVATDGGPANDTAVSATLDSSASRVAFISRATNLVAGVADGKDHVYVRDLASGTTSLVDHTALGAPSSDGVFSSEISGDGTKVTFVSTSANLPEAPPGGLSHIYEANLGTGAIVLVDRSPSGQPGNKAASWSDVNADGNRVAFGSAADNLGGGTLVSQGHIYVRDIAAGTTTWVSVPQSGSPTEQVLTVEPSISRDGNRVAFRSFLDNFGYGAPGNVGTALVRDIAAGTTTLASTGSLGAATRDTFNPVLSGDGSKLAFSTSATNLDGAHGGLSELYVRDLAAGTTRLAALRDGTTVPGRRGSFSGSLSFNGGCVVFTSQSDDLVSGGYGPDFSHVFLRALSADCPVGGGASADTTPPVVRRFRMTRRRFALARGKTPRSARVKRRARVKRGTTFVFALSEDATTRIKLARERSGRRKGKRCVKPRKGLRRRCVRLTTVGTLKRSKTHTGTNRVKFTGRIGSKALRPGRYRATLVATDAAGNRSRPRSVKFRVVKP